MLCVHQMHSNAMSNPCNFPLPGCITSLLHSVQNVLSHRAVEEDGFLSHESNPWLKRARRTAKMIKRSQGMKLSYLPLIFLDFSRLYMYPV